MVEDRRRSPGRRWVRILKGREMERADERDFGGRRVREAAVVAAAAAAVGEEMSLDMARESAIAKCLSKPWTERKRALLADWFEELPEVLRAGETMKERIGAGGCD